MVKKVQERTATDAAPNRAARWGPLAVAGAAILALCAAGCGKDDGKAQVYGIILVDDEPAKAGAIAFFPVDGKGGPAGVDIVEGKYSARVPIGENKVEIRVWKYVGERPAYNAPDSPVQQVRTEMLPARYNDASELRIDVKPGKNEQDFDLESG